MVDIHCEVDFLSVTENTIGQIIYLFIYGAIYLLTNLFYHFFKTLYINSIRICVFSIDRKF